MDTSSSSPPAGAVLALWNDIEASRSAEYERWHTLEHVPERVSVKGFRAGTRYEWMSGAGARYFTLYEIDSLAPLASPDYDDLVRNPTPWSASMRPSFRNFLRKIYTIDAIQGQGLGAAVLVVRAVWSAARRNAPGKDMLDAFALALLRNGGQACAMRVQIGVATAAGPQAIVNVDDAPEGVERLFLLHTTRAEHLDLLARVFADTAAAMLAAPIWQRQAGYKLSSRVIHAEVAQAGRPAPRADLIPDAVG